MRDQPEAGAALDQKLARLFDIPGGMDGPAFYRWESTGPNTDFGDWIEWGPSTITADAMSLLDRFSTYRLARTWDGDRFAFTCDVTHHDRDQFGSATADKLPMAICLAVLDATQKETP